MTGLEIFASSLLSGGLAALASVFLFKVALEKKLDKEVERFKSTLRSSETERNEKFQRLLEFRASQLRDFYWPLYLGLQKDNTIWRRILDKRDAEDDLRRDVGGIIEGDVVLPNHSHLVTVIEKNFHLAEADAHLEELLLAYVRHVAIYTAIRKAGEELRFPIKEGEEWPHGLFPAIKTRLEGLQAEYNRLLKIQEFEGETGV